jgi:hypothetical protein
MCEETKIIKSDDGTDIVKLFLKKTTNTMSIISLLNYSESSTQRIAVTFFFFLVWLSG